MSGISRNNRRIWFFRSLHNLFPWAILFGSMLFGEHNLIAMGVGMILFGVYDIIGYRHRWKHIYCVYRYGWRNMSVINLNNIAWSQIKKSNVYGCAGLFICFGIFSIATFFIQG